MKSRCARGRARLAVLLGHLRNPDAPRPSHRDRAVRPAVSPGRREIRRRSGTGGGEMTADERRTGPPTGHADLDTLADLRRRRAGRAGGGAGRARTSPTAGSARPRSRRSTPSGPAARPAGAGDAGRRRRATGRGSRRPARPSGPVPAGGSTAADPEDELARARARRGPPAVPGDRQRPPRPWSCSPPAAPSPRSSAAAAPARPRPAAPAARPARRPSRRTRPGSCPRRRTAAPPPTPATRRRCPRTTGPACGRRCRRSPRRVRPLGRPRHDDAAARAACAGSIPGATGSLRGVQRIRYEGQPGVRVRVRRRRPADRLRGDRGLRERAGAAGDRARHGLLSPARGVRTGRRAGTSGP